VGSLGIKRRCGRVSAHQRGARSHWKLVRPRRGTLAPSGSLAALRGSRIANASRPANRVRSHWAWIAVRQPRHGASANSARTTATATQRITRFRSGKPLSLFVFGRGLRFALRLFSTCNPRRSNLHQYRFVLFRYSLRQTPAFCRVLPEEVSVTVHDTFHLFGYSNVSSCKPGTLRTVPVEMIFADGTKAAIRRSSRALMGRNGERRNGKA
jgi:hypothetical protein